MMKPQQRASALGAVLLGTVLLGGCMGVPEGAQVTTGFDLDRYLGKWYEIARLDHRFERGMSNVTANYSMRDDGGVRVINRGYKDAKGEWEEASGKAYFVGDTDVGQLKVSFFGPFYGAYNIIELDQVDHQYALVVGPDLDYMWILARTPDLDGDVLSALIDKAKGLGFATDALIYVDHARADERG